ncbi:MAG TPA: uridine kinase [Anseongella sp.]|nr:uridine kinase [Anseongella sp.]
MRSRNEARPLVIGICGGSGSGKTYLLHLLKEKLGPQACLLSQDHYYKPLREQEKDLNGVPNFDRPGSIDQERFTRDLDLLREGKSIRLKEYTFNNPALQPRSLLLEAAGIIIVEGLFVFYFTGIRERLDLKVFVEAGEAASLERRLKRDQLERAYTETMVRYQWENHVKPAYENYLLPFREQADLIVSNRNDSRPDLQALLNLICINSK